MLARMGAAGSDLPRGITGSYLSKKTMDLEAQKVKGVELQPISPSSWKLFLGAPRVRRTYYLFAN